MKPPLRVIGPSSRARADIDFARHRDEEMVRGQRNRSMSSSSGSQGGYAFGEMRNPRIGTRRQVPERDSESNSFEDRVSSEIRQSMKSSNGSQGGYAFGDRKTGMETRSQVNEQDFGPRLPPSRFHNPGAFENNGEGPLRHEYVDRREPCAAEVHGVRWFTPALPGETYAEGIMRCNRELRDPKSSAYILAKNYLNEIYHDMEKAWYARDWDRCQDYLNQARDAGNCTFQ